MNNFWVYYDAVETFTVKEFCLIIILLLIAIVSKTVLEKD